MLGRRSVEFDVLMQWVHILRARWWPGPTFTHRDLYPAEGRNVITSRSLLHTDPDDPLYYDDLLWVDSDHLPSPAFIERIAEYPLDALAVAGTYFGREYPFDLQAWESEPDLEGLKAIAPQRVENMLARPGLYPVGGGGTGWLFLRREVLERMEQVKGQGYIWEIRGLTPELAAKLGLGLVLGEDVVFCMELKRLLGIQVWLDTDPRIESQHIGSMRVGRREWGAAHVVPPDLLTRLDLNALEQTGHGIAVELPVPDGDDAAALERAAERRHKRLERNLGRR
jgi:hypothetical protein